MFFKLEFEKIDQIETKKSINFLNSFSNRTCLCSFGSKKFSFSKLKDINKSNNTYILFYYLDEQILSKYYGSIEECINSIKKHYGVKTFILLPEVSDIFISFDGLYKLTVDDYDKYLESVFSKYI